MFARVASMLPPASLVRDRQPVYFYLARVGKMFSIVIAFVYIPQRSNAIFDEIFSDRPQ